MNSPARRALLALLACLAPLASRSDDALPFDALGAEYIERVRPLLERLCLDCHSREERKGELDLERFTGLNAVRRDPTTWRKVIEMLESREMPPERRRQPSADERALLIDWARRYLDAEARARAGDPGRVVLRRLSNAEYTYTVRDLTGVALDPARQFPVDGAAGEGFTNTGDALVMSPALVTKYLDAAREIASHAVLLPDGIRFSPHASRRDWTDEILAEIRALHGRFTDGEGRVDLERYFSALIRHRDVLRGDPGAARRITRDEGLSASYLETLARVLASDEPRSVLLDRVRELWRDADPEGARALAAAVRAWQDRLWRYNPVGHFGSVRPWQEPVSVIVDSVTLRVAVPPATGDPGDDVVLFLVAGTAGDGNEADVVVWDRPRFERSGQTPLPLRDLAAAAAIAEETRGRALASTSRALAAVRAAIERPVDAADPDALAARHDVDPHLLRAWLSWLGVSASGAVTIEQRLEGTLQNVGGYDFVRGWGLPGVGDLSLISNASDNAVNVPGRVNPHRIAVHPRPERWVAAGWQSPGDLRVRVAPRVEDMHPQCGNGVSWSLEVWRGARRHVLAADDLDRGAATDVAPIGGVSMRRGELLALIIGPRDRNHACDLTQIDLEVAEEDGGMRAWSLREDCADDIQAGNPHADRHGNEGVWHFFTGLIEEGRKPSQIPDGSLLATWLDAPGADEAARLADAIDALVTRPPAVDTPRPDAELRARVTSLAGPLFSRFDFAELARAAPEAARQRGGHGVDPARFGRNLDGSPAAPDQLIVRAPSAIEVRAPRGLVEGSELVVSARLHEEAGREGIVQVAVLAEKPLDAATLLPAVPLVIREDSEAAVRARRSVEEFNRLFPRAVCYRPIVPVDEVVTLVLFHREDDHLGRLMLDDQERARLDRLWDELHYVSHEALALVTGFEQLMEFATQDNDPSKFAPLGEPIAKRAAAFRRRLVETEPAHMDALLDLATRAYRRPLREREEHGLRALYHSLRASETPHDEAVRLVLSRILIAPAFLYRLEKPPGGAEPARVSDWELATRLSYFLWSSLPDDELRGEAATGRLGDGNVLVAQALRMLQDPRVRRLAIEFACQWLHIRGFDEFDEKSERRFPGFAALRHDMYEEAVLFFTDLFRRDGAILEILDADHAFLNEPLAAHYGIPGVEGESWRRVDGVREFSRGGILALGATLARHSGASRTSPILRGTWISETLLGEKLPRPPADVPQLPETAPQGLTERQLIERHSSDPACAKCHARIDPYGFALEGFDTIGRRRETDSGGLSIDARTRLADGREVEGINGLREYLLTARRDAFVGQFCRKLLGYALGRAVQLSDEPLLAEMAENLREKDWRFSAAVETIVRSRQFREIRGRESPAALGLDGDRNPEGDASTVPGGDR